MNLMGQGIPLGKWFGIRVELHWLFVIFAGFTIFSSRDPGNKAMIMAILFGTVLLHEFGHALTCIAVGGTANHIVLWPLGGMAYVSPPPRPWPQLLTTIGGPAVNAILAPTFYLILKYVIPLMPLDTLLTSTVAYISFYGCFINIALLVFNLLPVFPMDGGRIVQEILWFFIGYPKSMLISGMLGTVGGAAFVVLGLGLVSISIPLPIIGEYPLGVQGEQDTMLIIIGIFAAMNSFGVYRQAQTMLTWRQN